MSESLQEFVDSTGVTLRVDRTSGVLRGVKLIGLSSKNGRSYRPEALRKARSLYEGAKVNVNHPKSGPLSPRDYQDRLGVINEVEFRENEGLFGNLHYNPKHPLAEQLAWDAQHNPRNVGVSHNVLARVTREADQTWVEEITHVQSVDLVADPASTAGLYEHSQSGTEVASLSLEILKQKRPDLIEDVRRLAEESLKEQIESLEAERDSLQQRAKVLQQLCEQGLTLEDDSDKAQPRSTAISRTFFNMLLEVRDEQRLRLLIHEQASLLGASQSHPNKSTAGQPRSKDQFSLYAPAIQETPSAEKFAESLKLTGV